MPAAHAPPATQPPASTAGWDVQPYVDINSVSQGFRGRIYGANRLPSIGTSANVNDKGEFWIDYRKIGYC